MLKGVGKNLSENYSQKILSNRKEQLKNKEDVPVTEAFELYMLNKFFKLELNDVSEKMLAFWKKEFDESIDKHFDFLSKNLEDQNNYSLKFSEILESMDVFASNNEENNEENDEQENEQDNKSENDNDSQSDDKEEENKQGDSQTSLDVGFDLSDQQMEEQLEDSDSLKESTENVLQKTNINNIDQEYKVFTTEFDEIAKAEILRRHKRNSKVKKKIWTSNL